MPDMKPSEIFFTQHRVSSTFKKGTAHGGYFIGETLDDLCTGRCTVSDIPPINVMWERDKWWSADNRRLWVFRHFERLGGCSTIPVVRTYYIDSRKKSSINGGTSVEVQYNHPGGRWWKREDGALGKTNPGLVQPVDNTRSTAYDSYIRGATFDIEEQLSRLALGSGAGRCRPSGSGYTGLSSGADRHTGLRQAGETRVKRLDSSSSSDGELSELAFGDTSLRGRSRGQLSSSPARSLHAVSHRCHPPATRGTMSPVPIPDQVVILDPGTVGFTTKRIKVSMKGRPHRDFTSVSSVYKLWMNLVDGAVIPEYIPPIEVYQVDGQYWVASGNRRLWAFKQAAKTLPGLLMQAVIYTGSSEFTRKVNANNQTNMTLREILAIGDDVEIDDN